MLRTRICSRPEGTIGRGSGGAGCAGGISSTEKLTQDLVEILTVFSSRWYGSRIRKNLKAIAAMAL